MQDKQTFVKEGAADQINLIYPPKVQRLISNIDAALIDLYNSKLKGTQRKEFDFYKSIKKLLSTDKISEHAPNKLLEYYSVFFDLFTTEVRSTFISNLKFNKKTGILTYNEVDHYTSKFYGENKTTNKSVKVNKEMLSLYSNKDNLRDITTSTIKFFYYIDVLQNDSNELDGFALDYLLDKKFIEGSKRFSLPYILDGLKEKDGLMELLPNKYSLDSLKRLFPDLSISDIDRNLTFENYIESFGLYQHHKESEVFNNDVSNNNSKKDIPPFEFSIKDEYKDKLIPALKMKYSNRKPQVIAAMFFALKDLDILINPGALLKNKQQLHTRLTLFFEHIGTRVAFNTQINEMENADSFNQNIIEIQRHIIEHILEN
jgi:hypothetical protein